jgi:16S rRNA (cytosine1402-N4)-methyltransferase
MDHTPVLKKEVIKYLNPKRNENFIDCTFGEGGHTIEILKRTKPKGKVLAIEIDPDLYKNGKKLERKFKGRLILKNENFSKIKEIVKQEKFENAKGVLFDLGMCSWHLEKSKRGFSFKREEPLIMRFDKDLKELLARDVVNFFSEKEIERILKNFGQERFAKRIAKEIIEERKKKKIETTSQLVDAIRKAVPKWYQKKKIHFATKTFMALRIFVNKELENLEKGLGGGIDVLEKGGRMVVISFHSLEDRIVKNFFRKKAKKKLIRILTPKPVAPTKKEILSNPRSRSAKLRAAEKI